MADTTLSEHAIEVLAPIAIWAGKDIYELTSKDIDAYKAAQVSGAVVIPFQPKTIPVDTSEYINTGSTSGANWQKIASISNPTVKAISTYQQVDANFKAGECGVFSFNFRVFPSFAKDWICTYVDAQLRSKDVKLWRGSYFDGSTLNVCFITGIAPLIIAAIAIGALIALAAILSVVVIYKLKKASVDAYNNQQQELQDAFVDSVNQITDPAERAKWFADQSTSLAESTQESGLFDFNIDFEKPVIVFSVVIGLALLLFVFLRFK